MTLLFVSQNEDTLGQSDGNDHEGGVRDRNKPKVDDNASIAGLAILEDEEEQRNCSTSVNLS